MKKSYIAAASIVLVIALVLVFQNCGRSGALRSAATAPGDSEKASSTEISALYSEIEDLSRLDLSCKSDADCEAIGLGAKACGGPTKYIVVSTLNPQLQQIDALVTELEQKERSFNEENGLMSTCEALTERMPVCQQNICQ